MSDSWRSDASSMNGFETRPARLEDAAAVTTLINEAEMVDLGEQMLDVSDVEADWASADVDLALDTLVVVDGERLAAAAQVADGRADIDVHPDYRGRGLGTSLIAWSEQRAREQTPAATVVRVGQTVPTGAADSTELFTQRGYEPLWEAWVLRLPPGAELPPGQVAGVEIRPYLSTEERTVYSIIDTAFSEWEGRESEPFEKWQAGVTKRGDFEPSLLLIATMEGEPAGAIFGINYPDEGWADKIAVLPEFRGRGIASAMLAQLFAEFRSRGIDNLRLNTDSRTGALDLYLKLGMEVEHSFTRWSIDLTP